MAAFVWNTVRDALFDWVSAASGLADSQIVWPGGPRPEGLWISLDLTGLNGRGQDWVDVEDNPLTLADDVVESVDTGADTLTLTGHAYVTGDGPVQLTTTDTLPAGLGLSTDYWIVVSDADTIQLAAAFADSVAASPTVIDLTDAGVGTHTIVDTPTTARAGEELYVRARGPREFELTIQAFSDTPVGLSSAVATLEAVRARFELPSVREALSNAGIGVARFAPIQKIGGVVGSTTFEPRARMLVSGFLASEVSETATYIETADLVEDPPIS